MKSSIKSSVLKSSSVEIASPRLLQSPGLAQGSKNKLHGVPVDFPILPEAREAAPKTAQTEKEATLLIEQVLEEKRIIIAQAQAEAEKILNEAKNQADQLLESAKSFDKEDFMLKMEHSIRQKIIPIARAEGMEKGLEEAKEKAGEIRKEANRYLEMATQTLHNQAEKADKQLLKLCIKICEKILHTNLKIDPAKLLPLITGITLIPQEKEHMKIHMSGADWEWYKMVPEDDKPPYQVIVDQNLKNGDVFIESAEGIFDAAIDIQIDRISQYLLEELENGRLVIPD